MVQPRQRVTGPVRAKMAKALARQYKAGTSIRALAEEHGRSYGFVHALLIEAGVSLRGRGGRAASPKR